MKKPVNKIRTRERWERKDRGHDLASRVLVEKLTAYPGRLTLLVYLNHDEFEDALGESFEAEVEVGDMTDEYIRAAASQCWGGNYSKAGVFWQK